MELGIVPLGGEVADSGGMAVYVTASRTLHPSLPTHIDTSSPAALIGQSDGGGSGGTSVCGGSGGCSVSSDDSRRSTGIAENNRGRGVGGGGGGEGGGVESRWQYWSPPPLSFPPASAVNSGEEGVVGSGGCGEGGGGAGGEREREEGQRQYCRKHKISGQISLDYKCSLCAQYGHWRRKCPLLESDKTDAHT